MPRYKLNERFTKLSVGYEAEQKELKKKDTTLRSELLKALKDRSKRWKVYESCPQVHQALRNLPLPSLREFEEKTVIHESEALDGETQGEAPQAENRNLLFFRQQGRITWRIKPDLSSSRPNRNAKIFYTSFTFLSHMI